MVEEGFVVLEVVGHDGVDVLREELPDLVLFAVDLVLDGFDAVAGRAVALVDQLLDVADQFCDFVAHSLYDYNPDWRDNPDYDEYGEMNEDDNMI
jgi:hypothetical protein